MPKQSTNGGDDRETTPVGDESLPSCDNCRKRKLKCTRQRPSCANCNRLGAHCTYEYKKNRPGLKTGVVESLSRRLELVERALLASNQDVQHDASITNPERASILPDSSGLLDSLATLAQELSGLSSNINSTRSSQNSTGRKRRRNYEPERHESIYLGPSLESGTDASACPILTDNLDGLLRAYFSHVQPWIPMIHEATFRKRLRTTDGRQSLAVVLQAINAAALRYVKTPTNEPLPRADVEQEVILSRRHVIQHATGSLSVENLQALIIIAHTDLGNGDFDKAWLIIGSLTRAVDYLQLTVESGDRHSRAAFLQPLPSLPTEVDWAVGEERRRIFWNVFILDRFCSVLTGWNTSLTAADVSRRLPVCGANWRREEPASTAYFGIWDTSSAKIDKPISSLPSHYPRPPSYTAPEAQASMSSSTGPDQPEQSPFPSPISLSNVGGFAYFVESVESLNRVTSHFLHQSVDFTDRVQLSNWLTRFKELDLRLILWKMYIPRHWKDSGVSREAVFGVMDPNLTVANASHNVSMILLHQQIAYPGSELAGVQLPSEHSADTIQSAASENATIIKKFLMGWPNDRPVRPQLGFCAFVSARALLVHWRYYNSQLGPDFWSLLQSLEEMSCRWSATLLSPVAFQPDSIFLHFASQLRRLYERCQADSGFRITITDTAGTGSVYDNSLWPNARGNAVAVDAVPTMRSGAQSGHEQYTPATQGRNLHTAEDNLVTGSDPSVQISGADDLTTMSQVLMDQRFMDMDRIISFTDTVFTNDLNGFFEESTTWGNV